MTWSAKQSSAFEEERTRPVRDLVAAFGAWLVSEPVAILPAGRSCSYSACTGFDA